MKKPVFVVLAGGEGKRFTPFVTDKTLFPFLGKPLIQHTIEMIQKAGGEEVLLVTNKDNNEFVKLLHPTGVKVTTKLLDKPLGMGYALLSVENEIGNNPIIVMNAGDIVDSSHIKRLLELNLEPYAVVTAMEVKNYLPAGYLIVQGNQAVSILEKPGKGKEPSNLVKLVFDYFSQPQEFLQFVKESSTTTNDDQYEQGLAKLMRKQKVEVLTYNGYWSKLTSGDTVLDMMNLFLSTIKPYQSATAKIAKTAIIVGNVFVDENVEVQDYAVIKGPAYIGKDVVIGNHALVRQSMIEEKTVVGFGSEVARSYIGPRCMLHHNFIGDSVLEAEVNPSYGTTTANLRLDNKTISVKLPDKNVETNKTKLGALIAKGVFSGVNCSFMPGVTVGTNAKIHPGTTVYTAVEAHKTHK